MIGSFTYPTRKTDQFVNNDDINNPSVKFLTKILIFL